MVTCKICNGEYYALGIHLRRTHKISTEEYLEQFPNSPTMDEESRKAYSEANIRRFERGGEDIQNFFRAQNVYANSEENKVRLIKQNKDPEFIESQRPRLSKLATKTNTRMWKEDYETCKERATRNALWAARTSCVTRTQKMVANYLAESNINYTLEKYFTFEGKRIRVDIYLDDLDLVIETNGDYWHGRPDADYETMSDYQKEGYDRDRFKERAFGNRVMFLWEDEIYSGEYKSKVDEFITIGHVKLGELLET